MLRLPKFRKLLNTTSVINLFIFQSETGTLKVSGYVRGPALSVNSLVHLPGFGDFQMAQIDSPTDPNPLTIATNAKHMVSIYTLNNIFKRVLQILALKYER